MLEKPEIADDKIVACLRETYGVFATALEFLPLGHDESAGVYRVTASAGETYFLKARKGAIDPVSLVVPRYLRDHGMPQVVAPLSPIVAGPPWGLVNDYALILYPFVEARNAADVGFSDSQWVEYGAIFRQLHATPLSDAIRSQVPRETFVSSWGQGVERLQARLDATAPTDLDSRGRELAAMWATHRPEIERLISLMQALRSGLQAKPGELVLCHTDLHLANVLIDPAGRLLAIDWDMPLLAPRERDLHFVIQSRIVWRHPIGPAEEELIFRGYGPTELDWPALIYFRCEWACGDLYEYGEAALGNRDPRDAARDDALGRFRTMFEPGSSMASVNQLIERAPTGALAGRPWVTAACQR